MAITSTTHLLTQAKARSKGLRPLCRLCCIILHILASFHVADQCACVEYTVQARSNLDYTALTSGEKTAIGYTHTRTHNTIDT